MQFKKNSGLSVVHCLKRYLERVLNKLSLSSLLSTQPILYFAPEASHCDCGNKLNVLKTYKRKVATLAVGEFTAHVTQSICHHCKKVYGSDELHNIVPPSSQFGFDIITYVGEAQFTHHKSDCDIVQALKAKNIKISLREIAHLGKKYIVCLTLAHQACHAMIKQHMQSKGGYILHIDGTCEHDSPHLLSAMDEISQIVLDNIKVPTENSAHITSQLMRLKENYGVPLAMMHDMSHNITQAVTQVFPDVPDYICHYHFLREN